MTATGEVLVAAGRELGRARAVDELVAEGVEAIAVCYLFSFLNPAHERRTREIIAERHPQIMVSLSSEVDPAFREYERTCVTAFDAYIKPVVGRYLESMEQDLAADGVETPLQIMQSRGGISSSAIARQRPVRLFLSGPAAGVIGGLEVGRAAGIDDLITVDIGGTSCDIALISRGQAAHPGGRRDRRLFGARADGRCERDRRGRRVASRGSMRAGSLRVGPALGRLGAGPRLLRPRRRAGDGDRCIDRPGLHRSGLLRGRFAEALAGPRAPDDRDDDRAARSVSVSNRQRSASIASSTPRWRKRSGSSRSAAASIPRGYTLLPLGGGGPLHATALARELGIRRIVVPPHPGVLSATGLLFAPDRT